MTKKIHASAAPMLLFALVWLVVASAGSGGMALGSDKSDKSAKPSFAGQWTFNPSQSDNASDKIHEAELNSQISQRGSGGSNPGGGGYPGGGYPGGGTGMGRGGIGMGGGGMGRGGMGRGQRGPAAPSGGINGEDEDMDTLARDPKTLTIGQNQQQFSISDDTGRSQTLYADGKKHKEEDSSGQKTSVKTHWDSNRLVSESKLGHSGKLTESYELSQDGKQLFYTSRLDSSNLAGPLTIRRVYDKSAVHLQ